jgi:hypothetical protein
LLSPSATDIFVVKFRVVNFFVNKSAFTDERLLDCNGTLDALTKLLPQLLAIMEFPLPYQWGTQYGNPAEPPMSRPDIDLPLNTVISRSELRGSPSYQLQRKREAEREAHRDAKRAKHATWRPNRGPGAGVRGRGPRR